MNNNVITRLLIITYLFFIFLYVNFDYVLNRIRCPFYTLTHIPCAGCGATRAVKLLYEGKIKDAMRHNILAVISLPFLIVSLFSNKLLNILEKQSVSRIIIAIIIGFFLLRFFSSIYIREIHL